MPAPSDGKNSQDARMVQSQQVVLGIEDARFLLAEAFQDGVSAIRAEQQRFIEEVLPAVAQLQAKFLGSTVASASPAPAPAETEYTGATSPSRNAFGMGSPSGSPPLAPLEGEHAVAASPSSADIWREVSKPSCSPSPPPADAVIRSPSKNVKAGRRPSPSPLSADVEQEMAMSPSKSARSCRSSPSCSPSRLNSRFVNVGQGAADTDIDWASIPMAWPNMSDVESRAGSDIEIYRQSPWFAAVKKLVASTAFETVFGIIIGINLVTMCLRTQVRETHTAYVLGLRADDSAWSDSESIFDIAELIFSTLYIFELILRAFFLGCSHFRNFWNIFDMIIIVMTSVDCFITAIAGWSSDGMVAPIARLFRVARVARFAKIVRVAQVFGELRVIIRTLTASVRGLMWSVVLVSGIILAGGILITQLLYSFMENKDELYTERVYMYDKYGSAIKATWTMWGHTFTGQWVHDARRMTESVDGLYAVFWIAWIVGVNFAVMRVIAALFLKQTLAVASDDAQKMALQKIKERDHFVDVIREIFVKADTSGDGAISADEFVKMIYDPEVAENFKLLELELFEVTMLFRLLADEDGEADYDEFLQGALQLKGTARNIDVIKILHETIKIRKHLFHLETVVYASLDATKPVNDVERVQAPQPDHASQEDPPQTHSDSSSARESSTSESAVAVNVSSDADHITLRV